MPITLRKLYDNLTEIDKRVNVGFGLPDYDTFYKTYGTPNGIRELHKSLSGISDAAGVSFGLPDTPDDLVRGIAWKTQPKQSAAPKPKGGGRTVSPTTAAGFVPGILFGKGTEAQKTQQAEELSGMVQRHMEDNLLATNAATALAGAADNAAPEWQDKEKLIENARPKLEARKKAIEKEMAAIRAAGAEADAASARESANADHSQTVHDITHSGPMTPGMLGLLSAEGTGRRSARERGAADSALRQLEEEKKRLDAILAYDGTWTSEIGAAWRGLKNVADWDKWLMSLPSSVEAMGLKDAVDKLNEGKPLTKEEETALRGVADSNEARENLEDALTPQSYRAGDVAAESAPFMLQFLLSPTTAVQKGVSEAVIKGVTKGGARFVVEDTAELTGRALMKANVKNWMVRTTGAIPGDIAAAATVSGAYGIPGIVKDAYERQTGSVGYDRDLFGNVRVDADGNKVLTTTHWTVGEGGLPVKKDTREVPLVATYHAIVGSLIENYTEMLGNHFSFIPKAWAEKGAVKAWTGFGKKFGMNDLGGEILEEEAAMPLNQLFGVEDSLPLGALLTPESERTPMQHEQVKQFWQSQKDIVTGITLSVGGMGVFHATGYYATRHYMERAAKRASWRLDAAGRSNPDDNRWAKLRERIDGTTNDKIGALVYEVIGSGEYNDIEKNAILGYVKALQIHRIFNVEDSQSEKTGAQADEAASMAAGYNAADDAVAAIQDRHDVAEQKFREAFGIGDGVSVDAWLASQYPDSDGSSSGYADLLGLTDENLDDATRGTISEYLNARSALMGVKMRLSEQLDDLLTDNDQWVRQNAYGEEYTSTDSDGEGTEFEAPHMLISARTKDGKTVYVVRGQLYYGTDDAGESMGSAFAPGTFSIVLSGQSLIVRDADTGELRQIADTDLEEEVQQRDAETFREERAKEITDAFMQEEQRLTSGEPAYAAGDTYYLVDDQGYAHTAVIGSAMATNDDGTQTEVPTVSLNGQQPVALTDEMKQYINNDIRRARLMQMSAEEEAEATPAMPVPTMPVPTVATPAEDAEVEERPLSREDVLGADPIEYETGDRVTGIDDLGNPVEGTVIGVNDDGTYDVDWADGHLVGGMQSGRHSGEELRQMLADTLPTEAEIGENIGEAVEEDAEDAEDAERDAYNASLEGGFDAEGADAVQADAAAEDADEGAMPFKADGTEDYVAAGVDNTLSYLDDSFEGMADADDLIDGTIASNLSDAEKALEKWNRKEPKPGSSVRKYKADMDAWAAERDGLQGVVDFWNAVKAKRRQTRDEDAALGADRRTARELLALMGAPRTFDEAVVMAMVGYKFVWKDNERTGTRGVGAMVGLNETERRKRIAWLATPEKGGLYPEQVGERIFAGMDNDFGHDEKDVFDAVCDVLLRYHSPSAAVKAIAKAREDAAAEEARREAEHYAALQEAEDEKARQRGFADAAEAALYDEQTEGTFDAEGADAVRDAIAAAEAEVDVNPTDAQKKAGNYRMGHVKIDGFELTIENPKGSTRSGKDASGKPWSVTMNNTYGYIRGTEGVDGDHIDVFLSEDPTVGNVYVIDQVNADGTFDEHKVMYGFNSAAEAREAYLANYSDGWQGLGTITEVNKDEFEKWVNSSHRKTKPFAEYKSVKSRGAQNDGGLNLNGETYSEEDVENMVTDYVNSAIEEYALDAKVVGVKVIGSRTRGEEREDSDIDVLVEYEGSESEDGMFNIISDWLADNDADTINGVHLDVNPITRGKSGTIEQFMERNGGFTKKDAVDVPESGSVTPSQFDESGMLIAPNGAPALVYHGTTAEVGGVKGLERGHQRADGEKATFNGDGIFFTPDRSVSLEYATDGNGVEHTMLTANVRVQNPYVMYGNSNMEADEAKAFTDTLEQMGYDGIVVYSSRPMQEIGAYPTEIIVFSQDGVSEAAEGSVDVYDEGAEETKARLSDELDENGNPFVETKSGSTIFGDITEEDGLTPAPIKLSIGENSVDEKGVNHGYGLRHIEAGHGQQILNAGFASIEDFVESVAKNFDTIREGNMRGTSQTYLLEVSDEHNNTLFIELSKDGSYWNVNSAGIFRERYSRKKRKVSSVPTIGNSANTDAAGVNHGQENGATVASGNSPLTPSERKDTEPSANEQENSEKSAENSSSEGENGVNLQPETTPKKEQARRGLANSFRNLFKHNPHMMDFEDPVVTGNVPSWILGQLDGAEQNKIWNDVITEIKAVDMDKAKYKVGDRVIDPRNGKTRIVREVATDGKRFYYSLVDEDGNHDILDTRGNIGEDRLQPAAEQNMPDMPEGYTLGTPNGFIGDMNEILHNGERTNMSYRGDGSAIAHYKTADVEKARALAEQQGVPCLDTFNGCVVVMPASKVNDAVKRIIAFNDEMQKPVQPRDARAAEAAMQAQQQELDLFGTADAIDAAMREPSAPPTRSGLQRVGEGKSVKTAEPQKFKSRTGKHAGSHDAYVMIGNTKYGLTTSDSDALSMFAEEYDSFEDLWNALERRDLVFSPELAGIVKLAMEKGENIKDFIKKSRRTTPVTAENNEGPEDWLKDENDPYFLTMRALHLQQQSNHNWTPKAVDEAMANQAAARAAAQKAGATEKELLGHDKVLMAYAEFKKELINGSMAEWTAEGPTGNYVPTKAPTRAEKAKAAQKKAQDGQLDLFATADAIDEAIRSEEPKKPARKPSKKKKDDEVADVDPGYRFKHSLSEAVGDIMMLDKIDFKKHIVFINYGDSFVDGEGNTWRVGAVNYDHLVIARYAPDGTLIQTGNVDTQKVLEMIHDGELELPTQEKPVRRYNKGDKVIYEGRLATVEGSVPKGGNYELELSISGRGNVKALASEVAPFMLTHKEDITEEPVEAPKMLTEEEILSADVDDVIKDNALEYINGKQNRLTTMSYEIVLSNVRNQQPGGSAADSRNADDTQPRTPASEGKDVGRARREGAEDVRVGGDTEPEQDGDADASRSAAPVSGAQSDSDVRGEEPAVDGVSADSSGRKRGGKGGTARGNGGRKGRTGSRKPASQPRITKAETSQRRDELKSELSELFKELDDVNRKLGRRLNMGAPVDLAIEHARIMAKVIVKGAEMGYTYIVDGYYKLKDWAAKMKSDAGDLFKVGLHLTDAELDEFIAELWDSPFTIDGEKKKLSEWASVMEHEELRSKVRSTLEDKHELQRQAESVKTIVGDLDNIRESLPFLLPQQQEDVYKAETQFFDESHSDREHAGGKGMMFTNGTGTGKTYTGLGIAKRFIKQGKKRILILTPSQPKVSDWIKDAANLGIDLRALESTKDKGEGPVITTFANLRTNSDLLEDEFDLVIYDESHRIMENKQGEETIGATQHYMLTNRNVQKALDRIMHSHPLTKRREALKQYGDRLNALSEHIKSYSRQGSPLNSDDIKLIKEMVAMKAFGTAPTKEDFGGGSRYDDFKAMPEFDADKVQTPLDLPNAFELLCDAYRNRLIAEGVKNSKDIEEARKELTPEAEKSVKRTKVVFLSATPFNVRDSLEYAEGYIFSYPEENASTKGSYNHRSPRAQFMEQTFSAGYRWRYGRLESHTENAEALSRQEVNFSDYLQNNLGTMSGRIIDSEYDYSRQFPSVTVSMAGAFNNALHDVYREDEFKPLRDAFHAVFSNYNYSTALFETMKVSAVVPRIKEHLAMGRKVVIFHRRKASKFDLMPPFELALAQAASEVSGATPEAQKIEREKVMKATQAFRQKYGALLRWEKTLDYSMPREQLVEAFGADKVALFSGSESSKSKNKAIADFLKDEGGKDIIVIQEGSGKEGISLHDTTGKHQRVLMSLALPQSPISFIQIEGRIYRIGNKSNAIFEYPLLGIDQELNLFAQRFNTALGTTENLALGSKARNLRVSIANGVIDNSGDIPVDENQGIGGKEFDGQMDVAAADEFDNAISDYFGNQKLKGKRDQRVGNDYYPTPEPIGYKMVQWAGLSEGESVLEPSAGHGAIARYVDRTNPMTAVEPSAYLSSQLAMRAGGNNRKFVQDIFENYHIGNKHDAVLMNPPYGVGGALAIKHLGKAFNHLEEGGRVIAIIPSGPAADKKFDAWYNEYYGKHGAVFRGEVLLPQCTFGRAGTSVMTRIVVIDKVTRPEARKAAAADTQYVDLRSDETVEELFENLRDMSMPDRVIDPVARGIKAVKKTKSALEANKKVVTGVTVGNEGVEVYVKGRYGGNSILRASWDRLGNPLHRRSIYMGYISVADAVEKFMNGEKDVELPVGWEYFKYKMGDEKVAEQVKDTLELVKRTVENILGMDEKAIRDDYAANYSYSPSSNSVGVSPSFASPVQHGASNARKGSDAYTLTQEEHTQTGAAIYVARPSSRERMGREDYDTYKELAKSNGGYWSSYKKGFVFDSKEKADAFMNGSGNAELQMTDDDVLYRIDNEEFLDPNDKTSLTYDEADELRSRFEGISTNDLQDIIAASINSEDYERAAKASTEIARRIAEGESYKEGSDEELPRQNAFYARALEATYAGRARGNETQGEGGLRTLAGPRTREAAQEAERRSLARERAIAQEQGNWFGDGNLEAIADLTNEIGQGAEAVHIYKGLDGTLAEGKSVLVVPVYSDTNLWDHLVSSSIRNTIPGIEPVNLVGLCEYNGSLATIFTRNYIEGVPLDDYMEERGYELESREGRLFRENLVKEHLKKAAKEAGVPMMRATRDIDGHLAFETKDYLLSDFHGGNIIIDENGEPHIIDCVLSTFDEIQPSAINYVDVDANRYRPADEAEAQELDQEPTMRVYRAMQLVENEDGTKMLVPPMAGKIEGKWQTGIKLDADGNILPGQWEVSDERPDLLTKNGKFRLFKGNGKSVDAAYNPYFHTSPTPLNDQFSEAQARPNLVTVEVEVPVSELTSGYRAEGAKDTAGRMEWKAGIIQGQLTGTRSVILSRYDKPARIVPDDEVAKVIVGMFGKAKITMPSNVVTPSLRAELEKLGVPFVETDNKGRLTQGENKGEYYSKVYGNSAAKLRDAEQSFLNARDSGKWKRGKGHPTIDHLARHLKMWTDAFGERVKFEVHRDGSAFTGRKAKAKGWFDTKTGKVHIILDNHHSDTDLQRTIFHEVAAHLGLRKMLGKDFYTFLNNIYENAEQRIKDEIDKMAREKYDGNRATATEEYMAKIAERMAGDVFEDSPSHRFWYRMLEFAKKNLMELLRKIGIKLNFELTDEDVAYVLWESYQGVRYGKAGSNIFETAADIDMQQRLGVRNFENEDRLRALRRKVRHMDHSVAEDETEYDGDITKSENFKNWFGDWEKAPENASKVVDDNGKPLVVYHGTPNEFYVFDKEKIGENTDLGFYGTGFYFARSKENAQQYGDKLMPVYLNIRNPFDLNREMFHMEGDEGNYTKDGSASVLIYNAVRLFENLVGDWEVNEEGMTMREYAEEFKAAYDEAYDGDVKKTVYKAHKRMVEEGFYDEESDPMEDFLVDGIWTDRIKEWGHDGVFMGDEIVAFEPNQIKSTDNNGDFDPDNDDIRFREGEAYDEYESKMPNKEDAFMQKIGFRFQEAWQDSMLSLKVLQDAITKESGKPLQDFENAYMAENRMSSMNASATEVYEREYYKPMIEEVSKLLDSGTEYDDIVRYAMAKHGLERNRVMREREVEKKIAENKEKLDEAIEKKVMKYSASVVSGYDEADLSDDAVKTEIAEKVNSFKEEQYKKYRDELTEKAKRDFSGLSSLFDDSDYEQAAQEYVDAFEAEHDTTALWDKINAATKNQVDRAYAAGLIDKPTRDKIKGMYEYYVPLRGFDETTAEDMYQYMTSASSPYNTPIKTAKGRKSVADDPFATIGNMAESGIMQANRNRMKQHLYRAALNHKTSLLTVAKQWYVLDNATGQWEPRFPAVTDDMTPAEYKQTVADFDTKMRQLEAQDLATQTPPKANVSYRAFDPQKMEHTIVVKVNGKDYNIYVNGNPRAAQAVNGLLNPDTVTKEDVFKWVKGVNNWMARNFTSRNPAFVLTNLSRDVIFSGTAVMVKENGRYFAQYSKNISRAFATAELPRLIHKWKNGTLDDSNEIERYFKEFMMMGGETGYTRLNTVDDYKKKIDKQIRTLRNGDSVPRKAWDGLWDSVEFLNRSAEDTTRFMVYMTSRQMGRSRERATWDAKEITVNFNKKGSGAMGAKWVNLFYVFSNAAIQALKNFVQLIKNHPVGMTAAMGTFAGAGMLAPALAAMMEALFPGGGDDDRMSYWDIPEWVRRNNLVFYVPFTGNKYITIPLPHELRPFYGLGEMCFSAMQGKEKWEDVPGKAAEAILNLLPLDFTGNGGNLAMTLVPTYALPVAQIAINTDYFGKPIYKRTPWNENDPEWTKAYRGTNAVLVEGTRCLSNITGGNDYKPGAVNANPAVVEHLFESYLGGTGKTINEFGKTISMLWNEDNREVRNIPVVNKFLQSAEERNDDSGVANQYYRYLNEAKETKRLMDRYGTRLDEPEYAALRSELMNSEDFQLYAIMHEYEKPMELLREAENDTKDEAQKKSYRKLQAEMQREIVERIESMSAGGKSERNRRAFKMAQYEDIYKRMKKAESEYNKLAKSGKATPDMIQAEIDRVNSKDYTIFTYYNAYMKDKNDVKKLYDEAGMDSEKALNDLYDGYYDLLYGIEKNR